MQRVWKYRLPLYGPNNVYRAFVPLGATVLSAVPDPAAVGTVAVYALVDDNVSTLQERLFDVVGTGREAWSVEGDGFVGSVVTPAAEVYHVFARAINPTARLLNPTDASYAAWFRDPVQRL